MSLSKRSIERRNERINGKPNAQSLEFMAWIKTATNEELKRRRIATPFLWQRVAIVRELSRRGASVDE